MRSGTYTMSSMETTSRPSNATPFILNNILSILLLDIPFQICFVALITIIGPLDLALWTTDILLVILPTSSIKVRSEYCPTIRA